MTATTKARPRATARTAAGTLAPRTPRAARPTRSSAPQSGFVLLFAVIVVLNLIGLVMVLSASSVTALHHEGSSYYYFERQLLWLGLGSVAFFVALRLHHHRLRKLAVPLLVASIGLLGVVLVPGIGANVNGSSRWIGVGTFGIQPSEFAKLGVLIFAADLLARRAAWIDDTRVTLRPVLVAFCVVAALIMLQPNLGTTIVIAAITFTLLFVAGVPMRPLIGWGAAGTCAACVAAMGQSYRRARVLAFLHPWDDRLNTGYQTIQSQVSLASGGLFGV